eukprot:scpid32942/ scgid2760/ 
MAVLASRPSSPSPSPTSGILLAVVVVLVLTSHAPYCRAQLAQCELCPCTRLSNKAASGPVELLLTRSQSSPVTLSTVSSNEMYRVRLQTSVEFQDFHVCAVSERKSIHTEFPGRYLPLQARLMATCNNVVTSGQQFKRKPGSIGELQFLWRSPADQGECVQLSACVQLSMGASADKWVHRSLRVCTEGAAPPPPATTQAPQPPVETQPPPAETQPPPVETQPPPVETQPPPVQTQPPPVQTQPPPPPVETQSPVLPPSGTDRPTNPQFTRFAPAASGGFAGPATVPSQGVRSVFPGPAFSQGTAITLAKDLSGEPVTMFNSDVFYQLSATSTQAFKRCYLLVVAEPSYAGTVPGEFAGRMRPGGEKRHQGYRNLIECSAAQGLTATSTSVFWKAPKDTPCVQVSVWFELTDRVLTRSDALFCRVSYPTNTGSCPAGRPATETCSRCSPTSILYFSHTGGNTPPPCCNGVPLGPDQQCCGGSIQPGTIGKGWLCCGNRTSFNPEEATCCRGNKQLGRANDVFCCEQKSFSPATILTRSSQVRCCGDQAFDPSDKLCCGGALRNTWSGVLGTQMACCPYDGYPFNPTTHNCMLCRGSPSRVIQPKSLPLTCCGTKPYNMSESVCCDFSREVLLPAVYTRSGCCGGQVYDRDSGLCCLGQVSRAQPGERVTANWRCCETQAFDPATHECLECSGFRRLVPLSDAYSCCGISPFSRLSSLCCNGQVLALNQTFRSTQELPQFACCGNRAFDPATQTCCSLTESAVVNARGTSCCGTRAVYNTLLGERCIQCQGGPPRAMEASDARICCGSELYLPDESACCLNPLRPKLFDITRERSASPRLFCCNGTAFDANMEKCCPNTNAIVSANSFC